MHRDPSLVPLSHQHQHGLALTVIIERGLKADRSEKKAAELSRKVAAMWEFELQGHFQVEEEVLFPEIRPYLSSDQIINELIAQHRELESLVRRIAGACDNERIELLIQFHQLLSRHIRTEERQLFQDIQARFSEKQMKELGAKIDASVQRICPITGKLPWEKTEAAP